MTLYKMYQVKKLAIEELSPTVGEMAQWVEGCTLEVIGLNTVPAKKFLCSLNSQTVS